MVIYNPKKSRLAENGGKRDSPQFGFRQKGTVYCVNLSIQSKYKAAAMFPDTLDSE